MVNTVFRKTNADIAHVLDFCRCQQCEDDQTFYISQAVVLGVRDIKGSDLL